NSGNGSLAETNLSNQGTGAEATWALGEGSKADGTCRITRLPRPVKADSCGLRPPRAGSSTIFPAASRRSSQSPGRISLPHLILDQFLVLALPRPTARDHAIFNFIQ